MCGRVVVAMPRDVLAAELGVDEVVGPDLGRRWNVAPTDHLYAMAGRRRPAEDTAGRRRPAEDTAGRRRPAEDTAGRRRPAGDTLTRRLGTMSWGLVPSWATDPHSGPRPINARIESLGNRPHFAGALSARRCLVPVDGFYEWSSVNGARQPHVLVPPDGSVLAIAAVWDRWAGRPGGGDAEPLVSCALVTTAANDDVAPLHDRMPAFVERRHWDEWLDPDNRDPDALLELLRRPPVGGLVARPVSRLVNSTANDGPELLGEPEPEAPSLFPA